MLKFPTLILTPLILQCLRRLKNSWFILLLLLEPMYASFRFLYVHKFLQEIKINRLARYACKLS